MPRIVRTSNSPERLEIMSIAGATGWMATFTDGGLYPVMMWALLKGGEVIGVIAHGGELVSAENTPGFSGFRPTK
jgi:hypothetical protein